MGLNEEGRVEKASKATQSKRVTQIYKELLRQTSSGDIVDKFTREWNVKERVIYDYIKKARVKIDQISEKAQEELFREHVAIRRDMREEAWSGGDLGLAFNILKDEAKLLNLYPEESLKVKQDTTIEIKYLNDWRKGDESHSLPAPEEVIVEGEVREMVEGEEN